MTAAVLQEEGRWASKVEGHTAEIDEVRREADEKLRGKAKNEWWWRVWCILALKELKRSHTERVHVVAALRVQSERSAAQVDAVIASRDLLEERLAIADAMLLEKERDLAVGFTAFTEDWAAEEDSMLAAFTSTSMSMSSSSSSPFSSSFASKTVTATTTNRTAVAVTRGESKVPGVRPGERRAVGEAWEAKGGDGV